MLTQIFSYFASSKQPVSKRDMPFSFPDIEDFKAKALRAATSCHSFDQLYVAVNFYKELARRGLCTNFYSVGQVETLIAYLDKIAQNKFPGRRFRNSN